MSLESITKNIEAAIGYRENYETDIAKKDLSKLLRVVRVAQDLGMELERALKELERADGVEGE